MSSLLIPFKTHASFGGGKVLFPWKRGGRKFDTLLRCLWLVRSSPWTLAAVRATAFMLSNGHICAVTKEPEGSKAYILVTISETRGYVQVQSREHREN